MDPRNAETAMAWLHGGGLPSPQGLPDDDFERRAIEVATCFAVYPGVLETILAMTVFRPPVNHALPKATGEFDQYALVREGQNQVAAALLTYIDHAQQTERRRNDASVHVQRDPQDDGAAGRPGSSDAAFTDAGFHVG